eukprot:CAMPEP_0204607376 /NCGR_PEP_ID=MMETSP0661-20131031/59674_1 /ASSEMBLY_ACC=CAM_ASM_000606 /TAXON_ID=109239 /ORGANISM="Alexandrium margalefi, Strain AMGDE01CS-322" /LENGTH=125 /DNA_ID=CAMNT_0051618783 /DNA_START=43 /DNA_END=416 /DNA_ORIENTATION=+
MKRPAPSRPAAHQLAQALLYSTVRLIARACLPAWLEIEEVVGGGKTHAVEQRVHLRQSPHGLAYLPERESGSDGPRGGEPAPLRAGVDCRAAASMRLCWASLCIHWWAHRNASVAEPLEEVPAAL